MGVDFTSGAGYGFSYLSRQPPELSGIEYSEDPHDMWLDGEIDTKLDKLGFGLIETDTGGDGMGNDGRRWSFILRGSTPERTSKFHTRLVQDLDERVVTREAQMQLMDLALLVGYTGHIGWQVYFNIS